MWAVEVAIACRDRLGEGAVWDDRRGELLRVDIARGLVHGWSPATEASWCRELAGEVSAVIPRAGRDGWVAAAGHRLVLDDGQVLATVEEDRPANRLNDCRCDRRGRLWAGTMSRDRTPGAAALYRLAPGAEIERLVAHTTISNGLGWSPTGDRMYFVDSPTQRIDVFDFDPQTGTLSRRRPFARVDPQAGLPDGIAVDAEGGVWVCLYGGGAVRRYGPGGGFDAMVPVPVTNPTSLAFGGPGLQTLYVTSAHHPAEPLSGAVLSLEPGVRGLPGNRAAW